ncbi:MAG: helix-turn-helix domain-containing protein [Henriciella sp.]|uniref:TetR/AcrR family transcriptional regulator n=1 Tax=Henriciella sp. TaxID=1968823 RepID=UPI0032EB78ED
MTQTSEQLLDGAFEQFRTHGFAKTSMSDIAKAAGVSRTALYNHFDTKEAVFRALSERINAEATQAVVDAARKTADWPTRLRDVMHARCRWVYDLLHEGAFGRELIDEKNRICGGRALAANDRFHALLSDILHAGGLDERKAETFAGVLINAVNGVLEAAETRETAEAEVELLMATLAQGIEAAEA